MKSVLDPHAIASILASDYGLEAADIVPLPGYYDFNARVRDAGKNDYVFKVTTIDPRESLEFQNALIAFLGRENFPVPRILRTTRGEEICERDGRLMRLLTFLPGRLIAEVDWTDKLLEDVGALVARTDRALAEFSHPYAKRRYVWDLQHFPMVQETMGSLTAARLAVVRELLQEFCRSVKPAYPSLSAGIIHGDMHQMNLLTKDGRITGIIDFGDAIYSYHIHSLAICIAHFMKGSKEKLRVASALVRGYESERPLCDVEQQLLPKLIAMRLAVILSVSTAEFLAHPGNSYVAAGIEPAWEALSWLRRNPSQDFRKGSGRSVRRKGTIIHD
jgi:Ser/Thr protein kinase RdoA (MazF antagonist)